MNVRTRWPWISLLLAAILALNPLGIDVTRAAFLSGESLSRGIWGPIVLAGAVVMILSAVLEWGIRAFILNRRARGTTTV